MVRPSGDQPIGCLKYGCIVALVLASLIGGGLYFYVRYSIKNAVSTYTQESPVDISDLPIAEEVRVAARHQGEDSLSLLRKALSPTVDNSDVSTTIDVKNGIQKKEYTFTPLQIEELLRASLPTLFTGRGLVVRGEGEILTVEFSVSVRALSALWESFSTFAIGTEDRFLNGRISARGGISGGRPDLEVKELVLAGSTLPEMGRTSATSSVREFLKALLAGEVDSGKGLVFNRVWDVKVIGGNLVVTLQ